VCTPNEKGCISNFNLDFMTRCNETGTELITEPCAGNEYCEGGACHRQECAPNSIYCAGQELRHCDENGSGYTVEQICDDAQRCDAEADGCVIVCRPEGCACPQGLSPCCMPNAACGCGAAGITCNPSLATGAERCACP
jgi:hypothetical protein